MTFAADANETVQAGDGRLRLAIVNDYQLVVAGVRAMLSPYAHHIDVVELDVAQDPQHRVDVALFDTYGQPGLGLQRVASLAGSSHVGAVAVYCWSLTNASRTAALRAGARALIAKTLPVEKLVEGLQAVAAGDIVETGGFQSGLHGVWPGSRRGLTARESETLAMLTTGLQNRDIASALFVSENTVRTHLKAVFRKLGVNNRSQAVGRALSDPEFVIHHNHR